jgi:hypothetical protein
MIGILCDNLLVKLKVSLVVSYLQTLQHQMTSQNRGAASILLSPLLLSVECTLLEQSHVPAMLKVHW